MTQKRLSSDEPKCDAPATKRLRIKSFSKAESDNTFLELLWRTRRISEGLVQLGSKHPKCDLQLVPLVTHSQYVRRCVASIDDVDEDSEGSPLVIDLPDCPGDVDIFRIVGDYCLGVMDEKDISVSNVVKLITTSAFLEMESLTSRALKFLEESAFNSLDNCLSVLATFSDNDLRDDNSLSFGEGTLFDKCEKAFLRKIKADIDSCGYFKCAMSCSMQCLLRVAQLLPLGIATRIFQSCRKERFGVYYATFSSQKNFSLISHLILEYEREVASRVRLSAWQYDEWDQWMEDLSSALPDWTRRSILMLHVAKSLHLENDVNSRSPPVLSSFINWYFLCAVLVELVDLRATTHLRTSPIENFISATDMDAEIANLQRLVGHGLGEGTYWLAREYPAFKLGRADSFLQTVKKFNFDTMLSIVGQLRDSGSNHEHILSIAKVLDACLIQHLQEKTFTVKQALLICREFPNNSRSNHADIYCVFEDFLRRKALSPQEVLDLTKLFDYSKLSDDVVEKLIADVQFHCDPRLRERFMEMQRERQINQEKSKEELMKLQNEHNIQTADLMKVRQELSIRSADLTKATEDIRLAENKSNDLRHDLEEKQREQLIDKKKSLEERLNLLNKHYLQSEDLVKVRQELATATEHFRLDKKKSMEEQVNLLNKLNLRSAHLVKVLQEVITATKHIRLVESTLKDVKRNFLEEQEKTKELCKMTEDKRLAESGLDELRRYKRLAESELKEVRRVLEEEQEKTTCQICFARPRDAVSLPCKHFLYCFECVHLHHQNQKRKICPACRTSTSRLLKCII